MAAVVTEDLRERNARLKSFIADTANVHNIFDHRRSAEVLKRLQDEDFYIFAYQGDSLVFWSNDDVLPTSQFAADTVGALETINNQYCIRKVFNYPGPGGGRSSIVAILSLGYQYPLENEFLRSYLKAVPDVNGGISIVGEAVPGTFAIKSPDGRRNLCYLGVSRESTDPILPDTRTVVLTVLASVLSFVWLQLMLFCIARRKSLKLGLLFTCIVLLGLKHWFKCLPFHLNELKFFSSDIYAYSANLDSLGDLLLNEFLIVWLILFLGNEKPVRTFFNGRMNGFVTLLFALVVVIVTVYVSKEAGEILTSLVRDSQVSFDVYHTHNVNNFTVISLAVICFGIIATEMCVRFLNIRLNYVIKSFGLKYLILLFAAVLWVILNNSDKWELINVGWLLGYLMLLDFWQQKLRSSYLSPPLILLSLFSCMMVTIKLHYLLVERDLVRDRVAYASHIMSREDPLLEYNFKSVVAKIKKDDELVCFLDRPTDESKSTIVNRINLLYLNVFLNRYTADVAFRDKNGNCIDNCDSNSVCQLFAGYDEAAPTSDANLKFIDDNNGRSYQSLISIDKAGVQSGFVFLNITSKKILNETVYPELLQPGPASGTDKDGEYEYAIYRNGTLSVQTSNYNFPLTIDTLKIFKGGEVRKTGEGFYELLYQEAPGTVIIIAGETGDLLHSGVLLSYIFGLHLLLSFFIICYRWLFAVVIGRRKSMYHFSLRRRVHVSIQSIVFISITVVGIVTIVFFTRQYQRANHENNRHDTQTFVHFIRQYIEQRSGSMHSMVLDSLGKTPDFQYALSNFAANEKRDADVYDATGRLLVATQADIYHMGLTAPLINPLALQRILTGTRAAEFDEWMGGFNYRCCYAAIKNDDGKLIGIVSVPFFSSGKEQREQVSNLIVALINIYALLLVLSSLLALLITSRITRTFSLMIGKFSRVSLKQNELIEWPYEDEIGVLVRAYNTMVRKVEEHALRLAQSERESAWREMAKQVAHEIKNPLTPMKLNIQYLQNAIRAGRADVTQLAGRVSDSMIEQIDNLAYIASEFSSFAKMPDAHAETLVLNELLEKAVVLHQHESHTRVSYSATQENVTVRADRSQFQRVLTNLLQNAIQAMPPAGHQGIVHVSLTTLDGYAVIAIKDNGIGIPQPLQDRIFKPYFTTKTIGTGIGLSMTRKIIELWKGDIWFESEEGKGTTFLIRLPMHHDTPDGGFKR